MKNILYILIFWVCSILVGYGQVTQLSGNFSITGLPTPIGGGKFNVSGIFNDPKGLFTASDVTVGMLFWKGNSFLTIDSLISVSGSSITFRAVDVNNLGFVSGGVGAILGVNSAGIPAVPPSGDSNAALATPADQSALLTYIMQMLGTEAAKTVKIYSPAHGLTLPTKGYIPVDDNYKPATTSSVDSLPIGYIVRIPDADTVEVQFSGILHNEGHGLTPGRFYYLQDDGSEAVVPDSTYNALTVWVIDSNCVFLTEQRIIGSAAINGLNDGNGLISALPLGNVTIDADSNQLSLTNMSFFQALVRNQTVSGVNSLVTLNGNLSRIRQVNGSKSAEVTADTAYARIRYSGPSGTTSFTSKADSLFIKTDYDVPTVGQVPVVKSVTSNGAYLEWEDRDPRNDGNIFYVATTGDNTTAKKGNPAFPYSHYSFLDLVTTSGGNFVFAPGNYTFLTGTSALNGNPAPEYFFTRNSKIEFVGDSAVSNYVFRNNTQYQPDYTFVFDKLRTTRTSFFRGVQQSYNSLTFIANDVINYSDGPNDAFLVTASANVNILKFQSTNKELVWSEPVTNSIINVKVNDLQITGNDPTYGMALSKSWNTSAKNVSASYDIFNAKGTYCFFSNKDGGAGTLDSSSVNVSFYSIDHTWNPTWIDTSITFSPPVSGGWYHKAAAVLFGQATVSSGTTIGTGNNYTLKINYINSKKVPVIIGGPGSGGKLYAEIKNGIFNGSRGVLIQSHGTVADSSTTFLDLNITSKVNAALINNQTNAAKNKITITGRLETKATNKPVIFTASDLWLKDVILVGPSGVPAIQSDVPVTVYVSGVFSTKSIVQDPDVTIVRLPEYGVYNAYGQVKLLSGSTANGSTLVKLASVTTGTSLVKGDTLNFTTLGNRNFFKYTGPVAKPFLINIHGNTNVTVAPNTIVYYIGINGVTQAQSSVTVTHQTTDNIPWSTSAVLTLNPNDTIEVYALPTFSTVINSFGLITNAISL